MRPFSSSSFPSHILSISSTEYVTGNLISIVAEITPSSFLTIPLQNVSSPNSSAHFSPIPDPSHAVPMCEL